MFWVLEAALRRKHNKSRVKNNPKDLLSEYCNPANHTPVVVAWIHFPPPFLLKMDFFFYMIYSYCCLLYVCSSQLLPTIQILYLISKQSGF